MQELEAAAVGFELPRGFVIRLFKQRMLDSIRFKHWKELRVDLDPSSPEHPLGGDPSAAMKLNFSIIELGLQRIVLQSKTGAETTAVEKLQEIFRALH